MSTRCLGLHSIRDIKLLSHLDDLQQSIALARILSTPDSPLPALLRALVATITLTKDDNGKIREIHRRWSSGRDQKTTG